MSTTNPAGSPGNDNGYRRNWRRLVILALVLALIGVFIFLIARPHGSSSGFPHADQKQATTFQGMSGFVNNGLTTDQVNYLISAFSKFSPKAQKITVATNTITPGPHVPGSLDPFKLSFSVTIDSNTYKGVASYSDLTSIRLMLNNHDGKQVFDSGILPPQE